MTTGSRRNRLIYFRISEEEFEQIVQACKVKGARNVSELARAAVQEFIKTDKHEADKLVVDTIRALGAVVDDIKQTVQQLASPTRTAGEASGAAWVPNVCGGQPHQEPLAEEAAVSEQESAGLPEGTSNK